jgi:hypothetical protein
MVSKIREQLPVVCSAYSAALLVYFVFFYNNQIDHFVYINLILFSIWSSYSWFIVWLQNTVIDRMSSTMISVAEKIEEIAKNSKEKD